MASFRKQVILGISLAGFANSFAPLRVPQGAFSKKSLALVPRHKSQLEKRGCELSSSVALGGEALTFFVPAAGAVLANAMVASGLPKIVKARRQGTLGYLNPLPFGLLLANCIAWVSYSVHIGNPFIFWGNAPGVLISLFMFNSGMHYATAGQRRQVEILALVVATIIIACGGIGSMLLTTTAASGVLLSVMANFFTIAFFSSPLLALGEVLRVKSSSPLCAPMVVMATLNTCLWTVYGIKIGNFSVAIPNGVGFVLSLVQLAFISVFRNGSRPKQDVCTVQCSGISDETDELTGLDSFQAEMESAKIVLSVSTPPSMNEMVSL
mmetsp:Transcript_67763/g.153354  ORF Transcript_67763/g.153354 Transcript_67763/m.153354 type:complete len:324 (+) Transcript_67763:161-1132(+)